MSKKHSPPPPPARNNSKPAAKSAPSAPPAPAAPSIKPANTMESKPTGPTSSATARQVTREEIAAAAFVRWQKFGGDSESNWLAAERELLGKR